MKIKYYLLIFALILISGCSNDDDLNSDNNTTNFRDITTITAEGNEVFQIDILNQAETITTYNISAALGLTNFDFINYNSSLITFFEITLDNFNAYQLNYRTSESLVLERICEIDPNEFRRGTFVSDEKIGFITTQENTSQPFNFLYSYSKSTSSCSKIILGNGNLVGTRLVDDNFLYVTTLRNDDEFIIKKIALGTQTFQQELILDSIFKATIEDDKLYVFYLDDRFEIFDKNSFELLSSSTFNSNLISFGAGLFESEIKNDILYTTIPYTQPSPLGFGPATIDLTTGEYVNGTDQFAVNLRQKIANNLGDNVELTDFVFDIDNDIIIYSFDSGPIGGAGGIIYTNFSGDILKLVALDYVPIILLPL